MKLRSAPMLPVILLSFFIQINSIKVHIVPHSHWDLGWLFTFEEYFSGMYSAPSNIEVGNVDKIISSVVEELGGNSSKKFIISEVAFIKRW